jgi:peptidyl-prolyl cis-trans isomerase C
LFAVSACRASSVEGRAERGAPSPSGAASAADDPGKSPEGDVLAQFDGRVLTLREFDERLASQPPTIRAQYATPEAREKLLEEMVRLELLVDEAKRRGIDRSPRVQVRVSELIVEEMMNSLFASEGAEASKITDEDVRRYYDSHSAEFRAPEERRAGDIVVGDRPTAEAVLRQVSAHPGDEVFFRQRARDGSGAPTTPASSGDQGFFSEASSSGPAGPIREAVFRIRRVGEVGTEVVESEGRFHVLMLTGVRPALVRNLADVQTLIRARLTQERRRESIAKFTEDLRVRAHTRLNTALLRPSSGAPSPSSPAR